MVKLKLKIGPKGQVIIPKKLREAYKIKENGYVIVEVTDDGLIIKGQPDLKEVFSWVRERQKNYQVQ
ncbi:AbrB/MazE/SpoVT family DNA-binding domain-containing protein [Caldisphaera sp.]|uniref:AbrB/MazE/SpoVT family DNA-binding domain-containing protein n=1 Tax=Caldisphaera sp. TaxID=2060322 RepID=UPI003D13C736